MAQIAPVLHQQTSSPASSRPSDDQSHWRGTQTANRTNKSGTSAAATIAASQRHSVDGAPRAVKPVQQQSPDTAGDLESAPTHVSTISVGGSSSFAVASNGEALSPTSHRTGSSFRSPTRWTNFEDSDDYGDGESGPSRSPKLDRQTVSSDIETQNLLEQDGLSEEGREQDEEGGSLLEQESNADPYTMSDDDKHYYTECFLHLLQKTQNLQDLAGALRGSDQEVLVFFQKSGLSTTALSQIWSLSDVNEDGWLNLEEFHTAMHLIVLHVKGSVPIPTYLPPHITPRLTPVRREPSGLSAEFDRDAVGSEGGSSSEKSLPHLRDFSSMPPEQCVDTTDGVVEKPVPVKQKPFSQSADSEDRHPHPPLSNNPEASPTRAPFHRPQPVRRLGTTGGSFAAAPALSSVADHSRQPLSPLGVTSSAPKGPPPPPPPRPANQQHKRSASLDLSKPLPAGKPGLPPSQLQPQQELPPRGQATTVVVAAGKRETLPRVGVAPPAVTPPPLPSFDHHLRFCEVREAQTQTHEDADETDAGNLDRRRHSHRPTVGGGPMVDFEEMGGDPVLTSPSRRTVGSAGDDGDWKQRCGRLRKANAELETERAKYAQIRLQLELRLEALRSANTVVAVSATPRPRPPE